MLILSERSSQGMGFQQELAKLQQQREVLHKTGQIHLRQLFYLGLATLLFYTIFGRQIASNFTYLLFVIPTGISLYNWLASKRKFFRIKHQIDALEKSSRGKIALKIQRVEKEITHFQHKLEQYEYNLRLGREHLGKLKDALDNPNLYDNRRETFQSLQQSLKDSIAYQQLIIEFYQEAKNRFEKELYNLEQDLQRLEILHYLHLDYVRDYPNHQDIMATQFKLEFLDELAALEADLPVAESESTFISQELIIRLQHMIQHLRHTDSANTDKPLLDTTEFSDKPSLEVESSYFMERHIDH